MNKNTCTLTFIPRVLKRIARWVAGVLWKQFERIYWNLWKKLILSKFRREKELNVSKKSVNTKWSFQYLKILKELTLMILGTGFIHCRRYIVVNNVKYSMNLAIHIILDIMHSQISIWIIAIQFVTFGGILLFFCKTLAEKQK
jgi:hypothetical protein